MNPGPDDMPHLLVIEHIDFDDWHESEFHLRCPFKTVRLVTAMEERPDRFFPFSGEKTYSPGDPFPQTRWETDYILEPAYCSTNPALEPLQILPVWDFYSRWVREKSDTICARIEIGAHVMAFGTCGYHGLIEYSGLVDNLPCPWPIDGPWPQDLPQEPGEYPIFYWSDGHGEFFSNGFCLEDPRVR